MKKSLFYGSLLLMILLSCFTSAQSNFKIYVEGNAYQDGETVYIRCNNNSGNISATSEYLSNTYSMTVKKVDILSQPAGYSFSNTISGGGPTVLK